MPPAHGPYTLRVDIGDKDLATLKQTGCHLCIARNVDGKYETTWLRTNDFLNTRVFTCDEAYRVFALDNFPGDGLGTTDEVDIAPGQTALLNSSGIMEESTGPINKRGPLTLINDFGLVRFGVSSPVSGEYAPMYFSRTCVNGTLTMTPIRKLKVWFESFVTIDGKEGAGLISETCEVDFTESSFVSIRYASVEGRQGYGVWVKDGGRRPTPNLSLKTRL